MSKSNIIFNKYKNEVEKILATENYTEYSFRFALEELLTSLNKNLNLIHEPKREKGLGAPDYTAFIGGKKIGYIETKEINDNLDEIIKSEQIQRYIESIDNLIISNYKRVILIRNHNMVEDFLILKEDIIKKTIIINNDSIERFERIINIFCSYEKTTIKNSMQLANELSKRAKLLKYYAKEQLEEDMNNISTQNEISKIYDFYQGMKMLIQDLNVNDCADAYAQTITYGYFLAKMNSNNQEINRNTAVSYIPDSISIIKTMFMNISGHSLPRHLTWIPDEIIDVLNVTDMDFVLDEFSKYDTKSVRDPFSFFYENFIGSIQVKENN